MTVPGSNGKQIQNTEEILPQGHSGIPGYEIRGVIPEVTGKEEMPAANTSSGIPGYELAINAPEDTLGSIMGELGVEREEASNMLKDSEKQWLRDKDVFNAYRTSQNLSYSLQMAGIKAEDAALVEEYHDLADYLYQADKNEITEQFHSKKGNYTPANIQINREAFKKLRDDARLHKAISKIQDPRVLDILNSPSSAPVRTPERVQAVREILAKHESMNGALGWASSMARQVGYNVVDSAIGIARSGVELGHAMAGGENFKENNSAFDEGDEFGLFNDDGYVDLDSTFDSEYWKEISQIASARGIPMPDQGFISDAIATAPATLLPMLVGIVNPTAAGYTMGAQIYGSTINELLDNNVPLDVAIPAAVIAGVGTGKLEQLGGTWSNKLVTNAAKAMAKGGAKSTPGLMMKGLLGIGSAGIQSGGEVVQEAWEAGVALGVSTAAGDLNFGDAWSQFVDRSILSAPHTAGIAGLYEGIFGMLRMRYHVNRYNRNKKAIDHYESVSKAVGDSDLQDSAPGFLSKLFKRTGQKGDTAKEIDATIIGKYEDTPSGTDDKTLNQSDLPPFFVTASAFDTYFNENETAEAKEEAYSKLGITEQQVKDATEVGGRIEIDYDKFFAYAPNKEFEAVLRETGNVWMGEDILDVNSLLNIKEEMPERVREAEAIIKDKVERQKLINLFMKNNANELYKTYNKADVDSMVNVLFGNVPYWAARWKSTPEQIINNISVNSQGQLVVRPQAKKPKTKSELTKVLRARMKPAAHKTAQEIEKAKATPKPEVEIAENTAAQEIAPPVDPRETIIRTNKGDINGQYKLVEKKDILPSHDHNTLFANEDHKGGQNRDYKNPETEFILNKKFQPDRIVNTNPTTSSGLPVTINVDGVQHVNAGNLRSILALRNYDSYKQFLGENIGQFGFSQDDMAKLEEPYLVREITDDVLDPEGLAVITNETEQRGYSLAEQAVSRGGFVGKEMLFELGQINEDETLVQFMNRRGSELFKAMQIDGVILDQMSPYYNFETQMLTEQGKLLLKYALLGRVIPDVRLLETFEQLNKATFNKLTDITAQLLNTEGADSSYSLVKTGVVKEAIQHIVAKEKYAQSHSKILKKRAKVWDQYASQGTLEGFSNLKPEGAGFELAKKIERTRLKQLREELNKYRAGLPGSSGSMFDVYTPSELLNEFLGLSGEKTVAMPWMPEVLYSRDFDREERSQAKFVNDVQKLYDAPKGRNRTHYAIIPHTSKVLQAIGARDLPLILNKHVIDKITGENEEDGEHLIDIEVVKDLPKQLKEPLMVLSSTSQDNALVVVTEYNDHRNRPVIIAIHLDSRKGRREVNKIASVYGRNNGINRIQEWINDGELKYIDKKRSSDLVKSGGLQLPTESADQNFLTEDNIPHNDEISNQNDDKKTHFQADLSGNFINHIEEVSTESINNIHNREFTLNEGVVKVTLVRNPGNVVTQDDGFKRNTSDYVAAIVPTNVSKATKMRLQEAGLTIYEAGDKKQHDKSLEYIKSLFFDSNNARGSIQFDDRKGVINLFNTANKSTLFHEVAHYFWQMDKVAYDNGVLADQDLEDHESMRMWLDDTDNNSEFFNTMANAKIINNELDITLNEFKNNYEQWKAGKLLDEKKIYSKFHNRYTHEKFASAFETYLTTGKAPAPRLNTLFSKIRDWMLTVYKDIRNMVKINKDVAAVFDRMLAVQTEIEQNKEYFRLEAEAEKILKAEDEESFKRKRDREKRSKKKKLEQEAKLYALATDKWIRDGGYQDIVDTVTRAVDSQKIYTVVDELKKVGIDKKEAQQILGVDFKAKLDRHGIPTVDNGDDFESLAIDYGYTSGQALASTIEDTKARDEAINIAVDKAVNRELLELKKALKTNGLDGYHGADDERAAALLEAHNDMMKELLLPSLNLTENQLASQERFKQYRLEMGAMRSQVKAHISRMKFKDAATISEARKLERKAMKEFEKALRDSDSKAIEKAKADKAADIEKYNGWLNSNDPKEAGRAKRLLERLEDKYIDSEEKAQKAIYEASRKRILANLRFNEQQKMVAYNRKFKEKYSTKNIKKKFKGMEHSYVESLSDIYATFIDPDSSIRANQESSTLIMPDDKVFTNKLEDDDTGEFNKYEIDIAKRIIPPASETITDWMRRKVVPSGYSGYGDLTTEQVQAIDTAMHRIIKEGRDELESLNIAGIERVEDLANALCDSIQGLKERKKFSKDKSVLANKTGKMYREAGASLKLMEFFFEEVDNFQYTRGNGLGIGRMVYANSISNEVANQEMRSEVLSLLEPHLKTLEQAMKRIRKEMGGKYFNVKNLPLPLSITKHYEGQTMWDAEMLLTAAFNLGNDANLYALCTGYGWTKIESHEDGNSEMVLDEDKLLAIQQMFNKDEWLAIQGVWNSLNTLFPKLDEVIHRSTGQRLVKEEAKPLSVVTADGEVLELDGGYYPLSYDPKIDGKINDAKSWEELKSKSGVGFIGTQKGHRVARLRDEEGQAVVSRPPYLKISVLTQHINKVTRDVTHSEFVTDIYKVMKNERLRDEIIDHFGEEMYSSFGDWIAFQANPNRQNNGSFERKLDWLRKTSAASILGFNVKTGIKQRLSYFNAISAMNKQSKSGLGGYHYLQRAMRELGIRANLTGKENEMVRAILNMSGYMRARQGEYDQNVSDIQKTIQFDARSLKIPGFMPKIGGKDVTLKDLQEASFWFIRMNDQATVFPIWQAAYTQAIAENLNGITNEMSTDEKQELAVLYADQIIRGSQPSTLAPDLSAAQRSTGFLRFTTAFMTFLIKNGNLLSHNYKALQNGAIKWLAFLQHIMENFYLPNWATIIAGYFLVGGGDDDDGSLWNSAVAQVGIAPAFDIAGTVPIVRDFVKYPGNYRSWGGNGLNLPFIRKGNDLGDLVMNLGKAEWTKAGYGFLDLSAYSLGVGSDGLKSSYRNSMKVYDKHFSNKEK